MRALIVSDAWLRVHGRVPVERGLLRGKYAMLSVTTGGTEAELQADSERTGSVEQYHKPFSDGVLAFVGINALPRFLAYAVGSRDENRRAEVFDAHRVRQRAGVSK